MPPRRSAGGLAQPTQRFPSSLPLRNARLAGDFVIFQFVAAGSGRGEEVDAAGAEDLEVEEENAAPEVPLGPRRREALAKDEWER